jgi:hypothetical protein
MVENESPTEREMPHYGKALMLQCTDAIFATLRTLENAYSATVAEQKQIMDVINRNFR